MDWIKLDRSKEKTKPLVWQLTDCLRQAIKTGRLPANFKLPSSRTLAEELGISRNLVILAYEQLSIEGYLQSKHGSGSYVAPGALWRGAQELAARKHDRPTKSSAAQVDAIPFRAGVPALDLFPHRLWGQLSHEVCRNLDKDDLAYNNPAGLLCLRQALCKHLSLYRGVQSNPEQIVITSGAAQAFDLLARMLPSIVKEIVVEDPMTIAICKNLQRAGLITIPIEVDEQGMRTELLPKDKRKRVIFVTPSHQFPLGGVLPVQRRIELVRFADHVDGYIIEDDYDSEFRHQGSPLPALQELAPERVFYVGTFSKMLFPGLRLGYAVVPSKLLDRFLSLKHVHDLGCPTIEQLVLTRFIEDGHMQRHILQMKKVYAQRRSATIDSLKRAFGSNLRILGDATGMHLIAEFPNHQFSAREVSHLEKHGVQIYPVEDYAIITGRHRNRLIFGYGNLSTEQIERGVKKFASALRTLKSSSRS